MITAVPVPISPPAESALSGVNVMIMGPSGTGKTHSIGTQVEADQKLKVCYLALEPGLESLLGFWRDKGKEIPDNLAWHELKAPKASFADLKQSADLVNTMNLEGLAKSTDPNRAKYDQYRTLLGVMSKFVDQRTGEDLGAVDSWGTGYCLVIDGLTGLCDASMNNVIGGKSVRSQADWQVAQDQVLRLLKLICEGCRCHFTLLAHVEREVDPAMGGIKIMASALGKAMAPKLPAMFSEVILSTRAGASWKWDLGNAMADLKTRNLEYKADLPPDFKPILEKWKKRGGVIDPADWPARRCGK